MSVHDEVKLCQENDNFCKMVLFIVKGIKGVREMKKNSTGSKKEPKHPFETISIEFFPPDKLAHNTFGKSSL